MSAPDLSSPAASDIRAALERLSTSETFRASPQLVAFLRFIVEATLRGEQDTIKGYTIGVEALGRSPDFDPQLDPIVRVEATRLRRTIDRYYAGPGADDPIRIELQPGSYVPVFRTDSDATRHPREDPPPSSRFGKPARRAALIAAVAVVVIAAGLAAIPFRQSQLEPAIADTNAARDSAGRPIAGPLRAGNGMPTLAVQPFEHNRAARTGISGETLAAKLADTFARFDTVNVGIGSPAERQADYFLSGVMDFGDDESWSLRANLTDAATGTIAWSKTFVRDPRVEEPQDEAVVIELATTLLQPFGVIRARERVKQLASGEGDPRYRCVIEASESLRSFVPAQHENARLCLEQLTTIDPSFASGFRYLATIYMREYRFEGGGSNDAKILDRALASARRAVELQPESSRAYHTLAGILLARGEIAPAFAAADKAITLNRYDLLALGDHGGRLISTGEIERGLTMLNRAARDGTVRPPIHHFYLFVGHHLSGRTAEAAHHASQITGEQYTLGHLAHALAASAAGDAARAQAAIDRLVTARPAWRDRTRQELERFFHDKSVTDRLERDLIAAGMPEAR